MYQQLANNSGKNACFKNAFWYMNWMFFLIFITKNTNAARILFFSVLCISLTLTRNFMFLKSCFLDKSLSPFVILARLRSAGFNYLIKRHLKHSLTSIFWILISLFLDGIILSVILHNCFQLKDYTLKY